MSNSPSIESIKKRHETLYEKILKVDPAVLKDSDKGKEFIEDVDQLLNDMKVVSNEVSEIDDYSWLNEAALKWQVVCSSVLRTPRDIEILPPPSQLRPPLPTRILLEGEVAEWINKRAYELSKIRKVKDLLVRAETLQKMMQSTIEDMREDWRNAQIEFGCDVLDGKTSFARQIAANTFPILEGIWLHEVKRLKAFRIWEEGGRNWDPGLGKGDYYEACEQLRDMLVNDHIKASKKEFEEAKAYIETNYLANERVDTDKPKAKELIETKARQIWLESGQSQMDANWEIGETYVRTFYENIIPAVMEEDAEKTLLVLSAFQFSRAPEHHYMIINCFEAALAIYFLKAEIVRGFWERAAGESVSESWTTQAVSVRSWPEDFVIPQECENNFQVDRDEGRVVFEGVMTAKQRDALLKGLTNEEHVSAVQGLFDKSRLLHRKRTL